MPGAATHFNNHTDPREKPPNQTHLIPLAERPYVDLGLLEKRRLSAQDPLPPTFLHRNVRQDFGLDRDVLRQGRAVMRLQDGARGGGKFHSPCGTRAETAGAPRGRLVGQRY